MQGANGSPGREERKLAIKKSSTAFGFAVLAAVAAVLILAVAFDVLEVFGDRVVGGLVVAAGLLAGASGVLSWHEHRALHRDITEGRRAARELREAEERFRSAFDNTPIGMAVVSLEGRYLEVNGSLCEILGYLPEQLLAVGYQDITHPEDFGVSMAYAQRVTEGRVGSYSLEKRYLHAAGHPVWVSLSVSLVRDAEGCPLYYIAQVQDITERKQAEEALSRLAAIVESSDDAIIGKTLEGIVTSWNRGAESIYGYSPEEIVGRSIATLAPPDRKGEIPQILEKLRRGEKIDHYETVRVTKDGRRLDISLTISPVEDSRGNIVGAANIGRDVTRRKRLEAEREALLAAEQEQSRRLRELGRLKGDFTAMVAHELEAPIAVIRGYTELLSKGDLSPDDRAQALAAIRAETGALTALVADVRASVKVGREDFEVHPRAVPAKTLVVNATALAKTLPGDHSLTVTDAANGVKVWADPDRIDQVLRNLLNNAAKYSPDGTPISLRVVPGEVQGRIRIEVADRGHGIHPDDARRIFDKFVRGRGESGKKVAGVGLGLYLSRRIVQAHGSDLQVDSTPGVGSVFAFELEVAQ